MNVSSNVKLSNLCKLFFYQLSTFHCLCLTADHIGTSGLGEIINLSIDFIIYNTYSDIFKENYGGGLFSLPDCQAGREICVFCETMHFFWFNGKLYHLVLFGKVP